MTRPANPYPQEFSDAEWAQIEAASRNRQQEDDKPSGALIGIALALYALGGAMFGFLAGLLAGGGW